MRQLCFLVGLGMVAAAASASAAVVTQDVPIDHPLQLNETPFDISAPGFDSSLGTLNSVTGELEGSASVVIHPGTGYPLPPGSVQANAQGGLGFPSQSSPFYPVTLLSSGGQITGSFGVDFTAALNPANFISSTPGPIPDLLSWGVAAFPTAGEGWGAYDEDLAFNGQIILTYNYTVPEPSAMAVLGMGLLGLTFALRRRTS